MVINCPKCKVEISILDRKSAIKCNCGLVIMLNDCSNIRLIKPQNNIYLNVQ
ncbi:MAG: hypothetical protein H6Q69_227 [Firmicutes bacterium]|nr:hypothetical protein [Bacillota bacterium]